MVAGAGNRMANKSTSLLMELSPYLGRQAIAKSINTKTEGLA